jgi:hypothetical protein
MKPEAYITHSAPGRCRLKIPSKRHDADYFDIVKEEFAAIEGVEQVNINPVTTSILILYNHEHLGFDALQTQLQESEHIELMSQNPPLPPMLDSAVQRVNNIDSLLKTATSGYINFNALLFIVLVTMAVRQLQQGAVFGPASTMLWYALQILMKEKKQ